MIHAIWRRGRYHLLGRVLVGMSVVWLRLRNGRILHGVEDSIKDMWLNGDGSTSKLVHCLAVGIVWGSLDHALPFDRFDPILLENPIT